MTAATGLPAGLDPRYATTRVLDELRAREFSRLDRPGPIYLDFTGAALYPESVVTRHHDLLRDAVFGNPHSMSPASTSATALVEKTRAAVLAHFGADPDEYLVIFTPNATGGLKLVGEAYPFGPGTRYLLTFDNHNSVNGIREFARARGATTTYVPITLPDLTVDAERLAAALGGPAEPGEWRGLFAYPAQSNFSGVQHSLEWIERAQAAGWDVLLDAAAFVPTNRLDLSRWHPDFVVISFYKMFGYPTGVGALLARRAALARLQRPWFAGGTITVASVQGDRHYLAEDAAAFEDGTVNFLDIPAVRFGLELMGSVGMDVIHERVVCLTRWLLERLLALSHRNGRFLVGLYGPERMEHRGGTLTMNLYDAGGRVIDHQVVEAAASRAGISIRTGCFCNPGAGETALGISEDELVGCFRGSATRLTFDDFRLCIDGKSTGAVRVSVGMISTPDDLTRFLDFVSGFLE